MKNETAATEPKVVTALSTCPRPFVEAFVQWVYDLPDDQYWDALVHAECLWNDILGRSCIAEVDRRSGWHTDEATSGRAYPSIPDGWQDPGTLKLNTVGRIRELSRSKEHRHSRIVADLVLERRAAAPPVKTESVDQQKSRAEAKELGSFYTPAVIVDYIVQGTLGRKLDPDISDQAARIVTIIDPACGDGNFLIGAAEYLLAWWWLRLGHEVSPCERARIIRTQLYGVDLDPDAVAGCKKNLAKLAGCDPEDIYNVRCGNSLIGITQTTPEQYATLGPYPTRDAYDQLLLDYFHDHKIKKENQKWDAGKKKTVTASKEELTLDDIRAFNPFHWEYEFPQVFTPGKGEPKETPATEKKTKEAPVPTAEGEAASEPPRPQAPADSNAVASLFDPIFSPSAEEPPKPPDGPAV